MTSRTFDKDGKLVSEAKTYVPGVDPEPSEAKEKAAKKDKGKSEK